MGSLGAQEEDEAVKRHSYPPPSPLPSAQQWHAGPYPHHHHIQELRAHETVINGTTWYHPVSPLPHLGTDSPHIPPATSPARYAPFNSVNFDGIPVRSQPSHHRNPHAFAHNGGPVANREIVPPPSVRAHAPSPYFASGLMPSYPIYEEGVHDAAHGPVGYGYAGTDNTLGVMPGYHYNVQNEHMQYYPYNGYARQCMPRPGHVYGAMPSPARPHGLITARGYTSMRGSHGPYEASHGAYMMDYGGNASYGMPPRAIRTAGKTFRQVVTWCGMTMPVTITSQSAAVVEWIQRQTGDLFGFDLEWKPNRLKSDDNSVALLQICGPSDCLIIQLLYTDVFPVLLKEFLSNAAKRLGGVGIRQDVNKLERDHNLACQGQVELGILAAEKLQRADLQGTGLKKLVDQVLGMTLVKVKKITMSNWEKEYLDEQQIEYACIDAWAAFAILHKLTV
eukprot:c22467_g1_i1 orf=92-1438(+)